MLIEKRNAPEINDIVTIKLASGEEIVGKLTDRTAETVSLAKPVQIIMQPINAQQMGLAFHPVLGSVQEHANVQFAMALLSIRPLKTSEDVIRNYIQATTSLLTPGAGVSLLKQ
jgi:hypothetical protein